MISLVGPRPAAAQGANDAYLDDGARTLVAQVREQRALVDRSILRYSTTSQERISASLRTLGRERLLYRRETASRIDWQRSGPVSIEVLGAREVVPIVKAAPQVPVDLDTFMPHLVFDRLNFDAIVRMDTSFIRDPFLADAEQLYRYRSGDTTTVRLQDGRLVRLLELEVLPRRKDGHLLTGSFWIDSESHAVVQAVFRLSDAHDLLEGDDEEEDVPGFIKPIEVDRFLVTVDYGLWNLRWWMPRYATAEGVIRVGALLSMPVDYELHYSSYEVTGDTTRLPAARAGAGLPATDVRSVDPITGQPLLFPDTLDCRPRGGMNVEVEVDDDNPNRQRERPRRTGAERDSIRTAAAIASAQARGDSARVRRLSEAYERRRFCRTRYTVVVPADTAMLLSGPYLPGRIYAGETGWITRTTIEDFERRLEDLAEAPWQLATPSFAWGLGAPGLLRYNRVEELSVGARVDFDLGPMSTSLAARIGTGDREPNVELGLHRSRLHQDWRLGAYHRLDTPDPTARPFSLGNSLNSLFFARDNGYYFRAEGIELVGQPSEAEAPTFSFRLYAERQRNAPKETDFSLPHLFDEDQVFDSNIEAARADQIGTELTLRADFGRDPNGLRWGLELNGRAESGTYEFMQPSALIRASMPLPFGSLGRPVLDSTGVRMVVERPWSTAFEFAAGTTSGQAPIQSAYYLGGSSSLRGYRPGIGIGESFWRARAELGRGMPAFKLVLFGDVGWAGPRSDFTFDLDQSLASAGIGLSLMDGILRIDLARALQPPTGWRLEMYIGAGL